MCWRVSIELCVYRRPSTSFTWQLACRPISVTARTRYISYGKSIYFLAGCALISIKEERPKTCCAGHPSVGKRSSLDSRVQSGSRAGRLNRRYTRLYAGGSQMHIVSETLPSKRGFSAAVGSEVKSAAAEVRSLGSFAIYPTTCPQ